MKLTTVAAATLAAGATVAGMVIGATAASAALNTRYVSTTGTDTGSCSTKATACATINYAISQANPGNTVSVASGVYNQTVVIDRPVTVQGAGAGNTIIDGTGHDQQAPYYGVVYVGTTGGTSTLTGFTVTNPYPFSYTGGEPEAIALKDTNPADTVNITSNVISEGTADGNTSVEFPIGIDSFVNSANTTIKNNTISGFFQGVLLEDNGPSLVRGNKIANGISGTDGTTVYPAEGVFFLSDLAGDMSGQVASGNTFKNYSGYGIAMSAGYNGGNCSQNPCDGSIEGSILGNIFALTGGSTGTSAIALHSSYNGNSLTADVDGNTGYVTAPNHTITTRATNGATLDVTQDGNSIKVKNNPASAASPLHVGGLHAPARG